MTIKTAIIAFVNVLLTVFLCWVAVEIGNDPKISDGALLLILFGIAFPATYSVTTLFNIFRTPRR